MRSPWAPVARSRGAANRRGFSLPELLIVIGIIALLVAILSPQLLQARRQAMNTQCSAQLQQLGGALSAIHNDYKFYPLWDDDGSPTRYTWVDVLVQRNYFVNPKGAYCPNDQRPDPLNAARAAYYRLQYPKKPGVPGIDYSYGISVPLSAGGWVWRIAFNPPDDPRARRFENYDRNPGSRVLAADGNWSAIYNLSGDALRDGVWNDPTQFDNMAAWRHPGHSANLLMQDGHAIRARYDLDCPESINTNTSFVWYPGEPVHVGPDDEYGLNWYPNMPPFVGQKRGSGSDAFPNELNPTYYTRNSLWTRILHK
jgi:prepilin-type N-terminal cleavage/methylation domain-containing protein/prepilin-type processing-associated H-X9-DG protein